MTSLRVLCAELCQEFASLYSDMSARVDFNDVYMERIDNLLDRGSAALAQPEIEEAKPTLMEIVALADEIEEEGLGQVDLVRRALARWGHHTNQEGYDG